MKMSTEEFMSTELGGVLQRTIRLLDEALAERDKMIIMDEIWEDKGKFTYWSNICRTCQNQWEVFRMTIKQFCGVETAFTRTDEYFGICTEDENIWLMKEVRKQ